MKREEVHGQFLEGNDNREMSRVFNCQPYATQNIRHIPGRIITPLRNTSGKSCAPVEIKGYKKIIKSSFQRYFENSTGEQRNNLTKFLSPGQDEMPGMPVLGNSLQPQSLNAGEQVTPLTPYFEIRRVIIDIHCLQSPVAGPILMRVIATGTPYP